MLLHLLVLVGSLYVIVKASDLFVDLASSLGKRLGLKEYFIGSLIVGVGTSLPELFTSVAAVLQDSPQLVVPAVFGTVIANLGAGFGLGVLVLFIWVQTGTRRLLITRKFAYEGGRLNISPTESDNQFVVPIVFTAVSVLLSVLLCLDNSFGRIDAGLFLIGYVGFMSWEFWRRKQAEPHASDDAEAPTTQGPQGLVWTNAVRILLAPVAALGLFVVAAIQYWPHDHFLDNQAWDITFLASLALIIGLYVGLLLKWLASDDSNGQRLEFNVFATQVFKRWSMPIILGCLGLSIFLVYLSGMATVTVLLALAADLNIGGEVLAASALAIGTSLPDIVVALNVARRGLHRMLVGHILQSNIFDVFFIMGLCGLVQPLGSVFVGSARLSILFSALMTLPLLFTIRTRNINIAAALGLFGGWVLFLALVIIDT